MVEISEEDAIKYGFINNSGNEPSESENPDTPITPEKPDEIDYSNEYFTIEFIENGSLGFKFINPYRNEMYENFNDYAEVMIPSIRKETNKDVKLIRGTKRPFGVSFEIEGLKFNLFLKTNGRSAWLACKKI